MELFLSLAAVISLSFKVIRCLFTFCSLAPRTKFPPSLMWSSVSIILFRFLTNSLRFSATITHCKVNTNTTSFKNIFWCCFFILLISCSNRCCRIKKKNQKKTKQSHFSEFKQCAKIYKTLLLWEIISRCLVLALKLSRRKSKRGSGVWNRFLNIYKLRHENFWSLLTRNEGPIAKNTNKQ